MPLTASAPSPLLADLSPRYARLLSTCEPYLVTSRENLGALELAPFGVEVTEGRVYEPTRLRSRRVIDGLHHLDGVCFGDQSMLMPRWVLFDCGEFPGVVFGFGREARALPVDLRRAYRVEGVEDDEVFVPLSMWVALRCAEEGAWFGHNLSSANLVAEQEPLPGLGLLTKAVGVRLTRATRQYGATQWGSSSLNVHLALGDMRLLGAWTPAHTHPETFVYAIDVEAERLVAPLRSGWSRPVAGGERFVDAGDEAAIQALHGELEDGASVWLHRVERREAGGQRLWLREAGAAAP